MRAEAGTKLDRYLKANAAQAREERKEYLTEVKEERKAARRLGSARLRRWRGRFVSWLYLIPSLIGVGLFFVLPFGVVIYYSTINNPVQHVSVGTANFIRTWNNNAFQLAARNTLIFSAAAVPLAVILSLWIAVIMESRIPFKSTFRTFFLSPMMVPIASVILVFQVLFDNNGLINVMLRRIGLSSVPKDQIEVARLEGAAESQIFWKIKLRYLSSTIMFVIIMSLINSFKVFREVYLLAGDYPFDSLYTMQHFMNNTFKSLDYQKLSSAAIIMAGFMVIVIGILLIAEDRFGKDLEN